MKLTELMKSGSFGDLIDYRVSDCERGTGRLVKIQGDPDWKTLKQMPSITLITRTIIQAGGPVFHYLKPFYPTSGTIFHIRESLAPGMWRIIETDTLQFWHSERDQIDLWLRQNPFRSVRVDRICSGFEHIPIPLAA